MRVVMENGKIVGFVCQVYTFEDETGREFHWNATLGLHLAQARPESLRTISLSDMDMTPERILAMYPDMDEVYALNTDINEPLLFVPFRGKVRLVDGWHRAMKASLLGVDVLPAYFLSQEEADRIRVAAVASGEADEVGAT